MRVRVNDVVLYFDVDGCQLVPDGATMVERPTIVVLHGGPGADHSVFKPGFGAATEFAQVVYLDQRGSGRSDRAGPGSWTWERWADDVVDFCDALGIVDPILVGTSSGGRVALTAALRHPERVSKLVLDSVMPGSAKERLAVFERLGGAEAREVARRYWAGESGDEIREAWERVCLPLYSRKPGGDPDAADRLRRIQWNHDVLERFRHGLAARFDPWDRLDRLACPTLVLAGADDPVATESAARRLTEAITEAPARLHVLPNTGHGVFRETPEEAFELLRDFVTEGAEPGS
ncbi:alpha/beta fold hydrolase [Actinoallomurus rhizosphaericola]|uniref:alpha/beta fold hydrolase n=1 Tax=Actinoallomurus rhizosphaericola TaxID=2952536 RepID=UPI00209182E3|nr:alpha/beta hydrolase [Actinoallomurus rhizosphaericola]MCO5994726.1 alpha/beta hydrolase [Actinoallomurus rhizosphaericola]